MKNTLWALVISGVLGFAPALFAQHMGGGVAGGAHLGGGAVHAGAGAHGGFRGGLGHGSAFGHGPGFAGHGIPLRNGVIGGYPFGHGRGFHNNGYYVPYLSGVYWWGDYGDSDSDQQVVVQPPPSSVVMQAPPAPQPVPDVKPANPLLIELEGNRFVRLTGNAVNPPAGQGGNTQSVASAASEQLPPVVLVFRDGHRQQVTSYSIIGSAIYASGSYWTNGYWTQKILLANLDLSATLQVNQERGVNFVLPSAPNQVVTRP